MATVPDDNAIDLIKDSSKMFEDTLKQFRVCHDLLERSGLFEKEEILEVDKCAIIFRDLGLKTTTLAKVSSNQWLDSVIPYYEKLKDGDATDFKEVKDLFVKQAGELSKAFKITSAWANVLCNNLKKTGEDTVKGAEEIETRFQNVTKKEKENQEEAKKNAQEATKEYEKAEAAVKKAKEDKENPKKKLQNTTKISKEEEAAAMNYDDDHSSKKNSNQSSESEEVRHKDNHKHHLTDEPQKLEKEANAKLKEAEVKLKEAEVKLKEAEGKLMEAEGKLKLAQSNEDKAKNVASKAADLLTVLMSLASTCHVIATYWTMEGARFLSNSPSGKAVVASEGNVVFWKGAKSNFEKYVSVMSYISNRFNFTTDAKLPPYQKLHFESLEFDLLVPANLEVKDIMDN